MMLLRFPETERWWGIERTNGVWTQSVGHR